MNDILNFTHSRALVSYIDLLGFADLIEACREDFPKIGKIASLLTTSSIRSFPIFSMG